VGNLFLTETGHLCSDTRREFILLSDTLGASMLRPSSYPIPNDGPVGKMLKAQNRHPFRPEHIHLMIVAPGHRKLVTHIFAAGDRYLESDVVFGVKMSLVEEYRAHHDGTALDGRVVDGDWFSLDREFRLAPLS
jgi:hydroxyquinol 1,2-dioxygenase